MIKKILLILIVSVSTCTGIVYILNKDNIFSDSQEINESIDNNEVLEVHEEEKDILIDEENQITDTNIYDNTLDNENTESESHYSNQVKVYDNKDETNAEFDSDSVNEVEDESNEESTTSNPAYDELADSMLTDDDFHTNEQGLSVYNNFDWDSNPISDSDAQDLEGWNVIGIADQEAVEEYLENN